MEDALAKRDSLGTAVPFYQVYSMLHPKGEADTFDENLENLRFCM